MSATDLGVFKGVIESAIKKWEVQLKELLQKAGQEKLPLHPNKDQADKQKGDLEAASHFLVELGIIDGAGELKPITKDTQITVNHSIANLGTEDNPIAIGSQITVAQLIILAAKKINKDIEDGIKLTEQGSKIENNESYYIQLIQIRAAQLAKLVEYAQKNELEDKDLKEVKAALFHVKSDFPTFKALEAQLVKFFGEKAPRFAKQPLGISDPQESTESNVSKSPAKVPGKLSLQRLQSAVITAQPPPEPRERTRSPTISKPPETLAKTPPPPPLPASSAPETTTETASPPPALPTEPIPGVQTSPPAPTLPASSAPEPPKTPRRPAGSKPVQTAETLPEWLDELLKISNSVHGFRQLRKKYQHDTQTHTGTSIDDRFARLMQPTSFISKKRAEQLQLIEDTLVLLHKGDYSIDQKTKIARGLMLVIKHQIEQENNTKSRLGEMVNTYLNRTDNSDGKNRDSDFTAKECMREFSEFSKDNLAKRNSRNMQQKIADAVGNDPWKNNQFYSLHQLLDLTKLNIAEVNASILYPAQKEQLKKLRDKPARPYYDKYHESNQGVEREDSSVKKFTKDIAEGKARIGKMRAALEKTLKEFSVAKNPSKERDFKQTELCLELKKIEIALEDYSYLIKIGEEKLLKLEKPSSIEEVKRELNSFQEPLKGLHELCAKAIKNLSPKPKKEPFLAFFNKNSSPHKRKALEKISALHKEVEKVIPAITPDNLEKLQDFEKKYEPKKDIQIQKDLDKAMKSYKDMNLFSTKNLSATKLQDQITKLTKAVYPEILALSGLLPINGPSRISDTLGAKQGAYDRLRNIEKQLETLQYLTKIAALKLDPSVNVVRRVTDSQAKKLQEAFYTPKELFENIQKFGEVRTRVLEQLEINQPKGTTPKAST